MIWPIKLQKEWCTTLFQVQGLLDKYKKRYARSFLEYLNRYVYLPRIKNREVLVKTIQAAVAGLVSGPFAYAERWDDTSGAYVGLAIHGAVNTPVVIDNDSVIVRLDIAEQHRRATSQRACRGSGRCANVRDTDR